MHLSHAFCAQTQDQDQGWLCYTSCRSYPVAQHLARATFVNMIGVDHLFLLVSSLGQVIRSPFPAAECWVQKNVLLSRQVVP